MKITVKMALRGVFVALGCFALIQLIPYGHNRVNPPVVKEPVWDSPSTRELAKRVCFNCHSNETTWPWYSRVAPVSWLIYNDVQEGRSRMNFSDWRDVSGEQFKHEIGGGSMPPFQYRLAHPEAKLTSAEKEKLIEGLSKTAAASR